MSRKILISADVDESENTVDKSKYLSTSITSNDVYFYSDVNNESCFLLNKSITDLSKQLLISQITFNLQSPPPINLYINSDGGELFGALSIIDRIKTNKVPVHSYVEGLVASASTLISISCHRRFIRKNSIMLVHQIRSWFGGTYENFIDENKNLELLTNTVKNLYFQNTKFEEDVLNELLKRDIYLNADDAIKYGLADEII